MKHAVKHAALYGLLLGSAAALTLSACTPVGIAAGAGATTGIAVAREGGIKGAVSDLQIKATIMDKWFKYSTTLFAKLNLTIDQGRVLITGIVQDPKDRVEAVRLAWQANGVKQVINEIRVADGEGVPGFIKDTWITGTLRTKMILDKNIQSINYSIDTVSGIVYLMGVAQGPAELNRVIEIAKSVDNVRQVISYVKMIGEDIVSQGSASASGRETGVVPMEMYPSAPPATPVTSAPLESGPADESIGITPLPP